MRLQCSLGEFEVLYKTKDLRKLAMLKIIRTYFRENTRIIILTFEVFWIVVFMLEKVTNQKASEIPQFIYVNF